MDTQLTQNGLLGIGHKALYQWRLALERNLGANAPSCLLEIGAATGEEIHAAFCRWLPEHTGVNDPGELDAERFGEVLSTFFAELGWGNLELSRLGSAGLVITCAEWAEAQRDANAPYPCCFVSAGLFADLLTRIAGSPIAIMEIECQSRNDEQCRFLGGAPETLEAVYQEMSAGRDYRALFEA